MVCPSRASALDKYKSISKSAVEICKHLIHETFSFNEFTSPPVGDKFLIYLDILFSEMTKN